MGIRELRDTMFTTMWNVLLTGAKWVKEMRYAIALTAIVAAMVIAAMFLRGYMGSIGGVVVAVNMGVMLIIAVMMLRAAGKEGERGGPYFWLYLVIACVFAAVLITSAALSLSSVFFHKPLDFREVRMLEPDYSGDYRVEESVMVTDLRRRIPTKGLQGVESKEPKYRTDRVVKQRQTPEPYKMKSGTSGLRIENSVSPTHPGMTTTEEKSARFGSTLKHEYAHTIPAEQISLNYPTDIQLEGVFVNAFSNDEEEWTGACPDTDTKVLTMVVLFPESKLCKKAWAMELPIGGEERPFQGNTKPVVHDGGRVVTWTVIAPSTGVGYYIAFKW